MVKENEMLKVALMGNPNSGKTTLFNRLTGLHQKVGNFPGITVEKKSGKFIIEDGTRSLKIDIVDLPGTYSLEARSLDEKVAANVILDKQNPDHPDLALIVVDASHLKTSLYLALQVLDTDMPAILVLNMADQLEKSGSELNIAQLSEDLDVPVVLSDARNGLGIEDIKQAILGHRLEVPRPTIGSSAMEKHVIIRKLIDRAHGQENVKANTATRRLDDVLTHPFWGLVVFLCLFGLMFQGIYSWAAYPMTWIGNGMSVMSAFFAGVLPDTFLTRLMLQGVWAGMEGVFIFIPQIAFLFFFVALLEETGYMARVSFLSDKWLRRFGLQGRSIVPLTGGMACAVPAILSARTIPNRKERLLTIMVTPLMSCSARLPVYTLLIALVIPDGYLFGVFGYQGLVLFAMYLFGLVAALMVSFVLSRFIKSTESSHFIMELPDYRIPRPSNVLFEISRKVWHFVKSAGKVIVLISIVLWLGASYGPPSQKQVIETKYSALEQTAQNKVSKDAELLEHSYIGLIGKKIHPIIAPLGYDWKIGIALITSFAAREVFVGTMATIYSVGGGSSAETVREKMKAQKDPITGKPSYGLAFGLSLLVFYALAMQCMSTLVVVKVETGSWKWPMIQLAIMSGGAYLASFTVYSLVSIL